jgi:hypothetical protein
MIWDIYGISMGHLWDIYGITYTKYKRKVKDPARKNLRREILKPQHVRNTNLNMKAV